MGKENYELRKMKKAVLSSRNGRDFVATPEGSRGGLRPPAGAQSASLQGKRLREPRFALHALRVTPAMEAGITDHVWTIEEPLVKVGLKYE